MARQQRTPDKPPPTPRRQQRTIHFLTQDELKRLFAVIKDKRDKAIFLTAYRHDLRASEVGLLQQVDINLHNKAVFIFIASKAPLPASTLCNQTLSN